MRRRQLLSDAIATTSPSYNCVIQSPMSPKRPLTAFRIDEDLKEGLQAVWERDGIGVSEQIRRAIRGWLEQKGVGITKTERKRAVTRKRS